MAAGARKHTDHAQSQMGLYMRGSMGTRTVHSLSICNIPRLCLGHVSLFYHFGTRMS